MIHRAMLSLASVLVPSGVRREWRREWTAELWYLLNGECHAGSPDATSFCLGAFNDALRLRLAAPRPSARFVVESPAACLLLLAILSASAVLFAMYSPDVIDNLGRQPAFAHVLILVIAILLLPAVTTIDTGARSARSRAFLVAKAALVLPAVLFGTLDFTRLIGPAGLQAHASLVGYVLALRWALKDQRNRCPSCLRLLRNPIRIGQPSNVFLDWYGTEFMCPKGHGLLHVPEIPTVSFRTQQWQSLDASWRSLFS